ncbi:MAG: imidazole glycerol phosphate synthase subunit HisH [Candidatus Gastranaerophilales bacterium]|nr:imidazole glycerol phosphate synthase subunit HisH [Candidatus Gastranaerophilales bacterium]
MITVIDYGAGNVKSIANILENLGAEYKISSDKEEVLSADALIFPGQGHFGQAVKNLETSGLKNAVIEAATVKKIKFLGICLGLQILFEESEEAPEAKGLSIFKGTVKKFECGKIPQIGWNNIKTTSNNSFLTDDYFYFVNSYYVEPQDKSIISSVCTYGNVDFCASVEKDNITAVQFHPEKSSDCGKSFFQKWLKN